jgi:hypothetical protein
MFLWPVGTNELVKSLDKGKVIENGLFFTKSFYEEKSLDAVLAESAPKQLSKTFEVTVEQGGDYFFAAHILPANNVEKISIIAVKGKDIIDILDVRVYVNDKFTGTLKQSKLDWELAPLKESKTIQLQQGKNTIRFESDAPYYPLVDAVRTAESEKDLIVENKGYNDFVSQLKSVASRTLTAEKETQEEIDRKAKEITDLDNSPQLRSAMYPDSYSWQVTPVTLSCPAGNYNHRENVPVTYTYYRKLSLSSGSYTFHTAPISGDSYYTVDPFMYLFKENDPHNYSWYNDDDSGYGFQSRISVSNIPAGNYYLVIRAYSSYYASTYLGRQGLVNVYQNGVLLNYSAPVAGYLFDISSSNKGRLNYFTGYSTGIPLIWLQENSSKKLKFRGETFWFVSPSDYYWYDDARMQLNKNSNETYSMLVSAEGAMSFYFGNCDAYGSAFSDNGIGGSSTFPNLKSNDVIISAPKTDIYNCTSWAGGITKGWFWGGLYGCQTCSNIVDGLIYGNVSVWSTWDNYFGNNPLRYIGATTYTRNQAYAYNGEIAMWSTNGAISGVTHASVRLAANNHPHGYDWESKAGANYRFFHPRDALSGSSYGSIFAYYRDASKNPDSYPCSISANQDDSERNTALALRFAERISEEPVFTLEESIEKGLTVIEPVKLDIGQINTVKSKLLQIKSTSRLQTLYNNWIKKIKSSELSYVSNPYSFVDTEEGKQLLDYAKNNLEESIVFFANVVFEDEEATFEKFIAEYLFCEIAKDKYADVIENIKEEWKNSSYDQSGRYIAPMPETFAKKYIKKLLDKVVLKKVEVFEQQPEEKVIDNDKLTTISPNPVNDYSAVNLNLTDKATVTIKIYNQSSLAQTILDGKVLEAGEHSFLINAGNLDSGLYVCVIEIDGTFYSRKFLKR